jgi:hypothetical protein
MHPYHRKRGRPFIYLRRMRMDYDGAASSCRRFMLRSKFSVMAASPGADVNQCRQDAPDSSKDAASYRLGL